MRSRIALVGLVAALALPAGASPSSVASRKLTIHLSGSGLATWNQTGGDDVYTLALRYTWRGALTFKVPAAALKNPTAAKFRAATRGSLTASWNGVAEGTRAGFGAFRCEYKASGAPAPVLAQFANAKRGMVELTLHPRAGATQFFSPTGNGASVNCNTTTFGTTGPPHFSPASFFRDTFNVRGKLTTDTAILTIPAKVLAKRSATVNFPREIGDNQAKGVDPARGVMKWRNRGKVVVRGR